ncbi:MAG: hypothetical protein HKO07_01205, partial [Pseudomonadales bacterium]|nr:hypothetical protein [Pseudomonadales bacterium]
MNQDTSSSKGLFTDNSAAPTQPTVVRDELCALLALQQLDGLGAGGLNALLVPGASALQVLEAGPAPAALQSLNSKTRRSLAALLRNPRCSAQWQIACKTLAWLDAHAAIMLCRQDPRFPTLLCELPDCP